MSGYFEVRTPARRDLTGHIEYLARDSVEAARRFLDKFEETAGLLASMPEMGGFRKYPNSILNEVRFFPIKEFEKYLIFYRIMSKRVYGKAKAGTRSALKRAEETLVWLPPTG